MSTNVGQRQGCASRYGSATGVVLANASLGQGKGGWMVSHLIDREHFGCSILLFFLSVINYRLAFQLCNVRCQLGPYVGLCVVLVCLVLSMVVAFTTSQAHNGCPNTAAGRFGDSVVKQR